MLEAEALRGLLQRRILSAHAAAVAVGLPRRTVEAEQLVLRISDDAEGWRFSGQLLTEPVFDDDGGRFYGDDLLTLVLERSKYETTGMQLISLYTTPVVAVELYAGSLEDHEVDRAIVLRSRGDEALMLSAGTSSLSLTYGADAIAETLAEWQDDWPELELVRTLT
jgi:hypothetical protein